MSAVRPMLLRHRMVACWLVAIALAMRLAVPAGFMPVADGGTVRLEPCSGYGPQRAATDPMAAMPAMAHQSGGNHDRHGDDGQDRIPCAFAGLHVQATAAVDPVVLATAIAFVLAAGFRPVPAPAPRVVPFLRPPLRGPPAA